MTRRRRVLAGVVAFFVAAASCTGNDNEAAPAPTSAAPESTTTTTTTPATTSSDAPTTTTTAAPTTTTEPEPELSDDEAAILDLIGRYWEVVAIGLNPPDADYAGWFDIGTEGLVADLRANAQARLDAGQGVRPLDGPPLVLEARFLSLDPRRSVVSICLKDQAQLYDLETGDVIREARTVGWIQHTVELEAHEWRVAVTTRVEDFERTEECVAAL